jgi:O-antigen/teichoic acid export membrane protein
LVSIAVVAYYVTPYEIVTKLWVIPGAMVGVLFQAFSTSFVQDRTRTVKLFGLGVKCVFLVLFPIALLIVALADFGLDLWLGKEFAEHSGRVLQWLTMGVLINSVANIPFALVQGVGRPDLTAKLHLIELPFYLFAVWWITRAFGIEGTAIVWLLRVIVDAVILFGVARRLLKESAFVVRRSALMLGAGLTILALSMLPMGVTLKGGFLLLNLLAFALAAWFLILAPEERMLMINRFKTARKPKCGIIYDR